MTQKINTEVKDTDTQTVIEDATVTFTSNNPSVATVDSQGVVTAVALGETTITVATDGATSKEVPITVANEFETTINYSSKYNSSDKTIDAYIFDRENENKIAKISDSFVQINATREGGFGNAQGLPISNGDSFIISSEDNILITGIEFVLKKVGNFEKSVWTNAEVGPDPAEASSKLIIENPCREVSFKEIVFDDPNSYYNPIEIHTIKVSVVYKAPIAEFSSVAVNATNVKKEYQIFEPFTMDGLTFNVTDATTGLIYEYAYGDENTTVVANYDEGDILVNTGEKTVELLIEFEGCSDTFEQEYTINIVSLLTLTPIAVQDSWDLVTNVSELSVGDEIIIAAAEADYALSTTQKSSNRAGTEITKTNNSLSNISENVQILTLESGTVDNTFSFNTGSGYLYAASSSSNHLKTIESKDANGSWSIKIADNVATIKSEGQYSRNIMQFNPNTNNGDPLFACYSGASQQALCIYKHNETRPALVSDGILAFIAAVKFGETPLLNCDNKGVNSTINWSAIEEQYDKLGDEDKNILKTSKAVDAAEGGNIVEDFLSDYDFIVSQHGNKNFIDREINETKAMSPFNVANNETSLIIIMIAVVALTGFAFFYYTKRKERKIEF